MLRVYLDCATFDCDGDRFRREITFVQWVREPQDGDVHVIMTSQEAGAGRRYAFDFEGRAALAGTSDTFTHTASSTDVEEEVRAALTQTLRLGLIRFVALAGFGDAVRIEAVEEGREGAVSGTGPSSDDPWNFWVFSVRVGAEVEREDRQETEDYSLAASANRTTEAWKLDVGFFGEKTRETRDLDDDSTVVIESDDWSLDLVVVKSLTDHWSVGASSDLGSSTRLNQDFSVELLPAVEWNYFPWRDASRRRFVVLYAAGIQYLDYETRTLFERHHQTVWRHRLDVAYRAQEPWGNARGGVEANQILDEPKKYSFEFEAELEYRLIRGLSVSLEGSYEIIRDQIYLSGEDLTPEEILLERRQLETGSRLSFDIGLSYEFGSIFNSVVNSRFAGVNGGGGG